MNPYHSYKDEELTAAVNQADFGAYEELVHRKTAELYRISSALTREHVRADQLLQQTVSAVWHECRKQREKKMDVSLLLMQTLLIEDKKRPGRRGQKLSSMEARNAEESQSPSESLPVKQMISQRSKQIEGAIDRMSTKVRQVFLLTYLAEKESSDIALYIGKTEDVVAQSLQQALTILARELGENRENIHPALLRKYFEEEREQEEIDLHVDRGATAVLKGLEDAREDRGSKRHSKRKGYRWAAFATLLILTSVTVLYMFIVGESQAEIHQPLNAEGTLVTPDTSYWKNTMKENPDIVKRLNEGDYLSIGQVLPVDNGLKLIVDGAMDTSTGFILWYTLENVEGAEAPLLDNTGIWNRSTETKIGSSDSGEEGIQYLTQGNRTQGVVSIPGIDRGTANLRPEEIKISFTANVEEERFRYAEFEMDTPIFPEKPVKRIDVNEYFTIQDQKYYIKYISLSTQNTRIRVEAVGAKNQSEADEAVERLVEPSLYVVNKSAMEMRGAIHSLWESYGSDLIYESIYYEEYTELSLQIEGFKKKEADSAVFIIDSNTGEVIHSDLNLPINMRISTLEDEDILYLHYPIENSDRYDIYGDFMDSEGNSYQISGAIKKKDEILYKLLNAPYIQPLQFHFYERNISDSKLNGQNEEEVPNVQNRLTIPMVKK